MTNYNSKNKRKNIKKSSKKESKKSFKKDTKKESTKKESNKEKKDNKKDKVYTIEEVKIHNKKTDAWLVINNKVYNVTPWINNHPGGLIIMKGVGKDASILYKKFRHSKNADNILKKFYIGDLDINTNKY